MSAERWPDLAVMELLVAVRDHGSIGAAATEVGMTQPNASRALRRLERRSGLALLVRSARGSHLTADALAVVEWAREALDAADRLADGMTGLRGTRRGRLRVAASQTVAEYLLPRWLAAYREDDGSAEVELQVCNSADVTAAVVDGSAELGFVETASLGRGVRSRRVGADHLVVVVAPTHRWARPGTGLSVEELARTPLVVREAGSGTRDALEHALRATGTQAAEPAQALASNAAVRVAAAAGVAPAVLSEHAVREAVDAGRLVRVAVTGVDLSRPLRAVWRAGSPLAAPAQALLETVIR